MRCVEFVDFTRERGGKLSGEQNCYFCNKFIIRQFSLRISTLYRPRIELEGAPWDVGDGGVPAWTRYQRSRGGLQKSACGLKMVVDAVTSRFSADCIVVSVARRGRIVHKLRPADG